MLSFLAKKDKNKTSTFISQRFHQHYWILFARHITQMTEINNQKNMSLFNNSSRQLRRITEQYLDVENVSEHLKTIQQLSFLPSKAKHIMVDMKSTQSFKNLTF
jgi:hypothetical protein